MALPAALSCHSRRGSFRSSVMCQMREKKKTPKNLSIDRRRQRQDALDDSCQRACGVIPSEQAKEKAQRIERGSSDISQSPTKSAAA